MRVSIRALLVVSFLAPIGVMIIGSLSADAKDQQIANSEATHKSPAINLRGRACFLDGRPATGATLRVDLRDQQGGILPDSLAPLVTAEM